MLDRVGEDFVSLDDGDINPSRLPDCDLFNVSSIAAVAGFADPRYFAQVVLRKPQTLFHYRTEILRDEDGREVGRVFATHANSAEVGGKALREMQRQAARDRVSRGLVTDVSSKAMILGD